MGRRGGSGVGGGDGAQASPRGRERACAASVREQSTCGVRIRRQNVPPTPVLAMPVLTTSTRPPTRGAGQRRPPCPGTHAKTDTIDRHIPPPRAPAHVPNPPTTPPTQGTRASTHTTHNTTPHALHQVKTRHATSCTLVLPRPPPQNVRLCSRGWMGTLGDCRESHNCTRMRPRLKKSRG